MRACYSTFRRFSPSFLANIRREGRGACRAAFSLVELLVVIAIIATLGSLVFVGMRAAKSKAKDVQCLTNLRSLGQGFAHYLFDNNNYYFGMGPGAAGSGPTFEQRGWYRWPQRLGPYLQLNGPTSTRTTDQGYTVTILEDGYRHSVVHCPFTPTRHWQQPGVNPTMGLYGINPKIVTETDPKGENMVGIRATAIEQPARTVLLGEHFAGDPYTGQTVSTPGHVLDLTGAYPAKRGGPASNVGATPNSTGGPSNFLFADGHVETIRLESLTPWPGRLRFDP